MAQGSIEVKSGEQRVTQILVDYLQLATVFEMIPFLICKSVHTVPR